MHLFACFLLEMRRAASHAPRLACAAAVRALSTAAAAPSAASGAAHLTAAAMRALSVGGVVKFVESLGIVKLHADKLFAQEIDGAALLAMTEEKLCDRCGVPIGPACAIMRAIAPAAAEVAEASIKASIKASEATLTVYPPLKKGGPNNPVQVTLTPAGFEARFGRSDPLRLVSGDGTVLKELVTLEQAVNAVETSRGGKARLRASRSFGDELEEVRGFVKNAATALEQMTTRALVRDAGLVSYFGPLLAVNGAEPFFVSLRESGKEFELEVDGLVVGKGCALLNSAKHTPTVDHVGELVGDAAELQRLLSSCFEGVTTRPAGARAELAGVARIVPFLSGSNFTAAVEGACRAEGVGIVRPSGEGFSVQLAGRAP